MLDGLTLKLAVYFATHIQAEEGGGGGSLTNPKTFETAKNWRMPLGIQLVHDLLINLHSNNYHFHGNKYKNPRWPLMAAILDNFRFLKFCLILRDFVENS